MVPAERLTNTIPSCSQSDISQLVKNGSDSDSFTRIQHPTEINISNKHVDPRIPTVKLKIPGKAFLKSESQVIVFDFCYLPVAAVGSPDLGLSKYATIKKCEKRPLL